MIERVHEHITNELGKNTLTDTIFVIVAILLNLITMGVNSGIASGGDDAQLTIMMSIFVVLIIVINIIAEIGLIRGRQMRRKLLSGLLKMYKDQGVDGYYDSSLLTDYTMRYNLFMLAVLSTGLVAIIIPFMVRF